jgi:hypothetical protein
MVVPAGCSGPCDRGRPAGIPVGDFYSSGPRTKRFRLLSRSRVASAPLKISAPSSSAGVLIIWTKPEMSESLSRPVLTGPAICSVEIFDPPHFERWYPAGATGKPVADMGLDRRLLGTRETSQRTETSANAQPTIREGLTTERTRK